MLKFPPNAEILSKDDFAIFIFLVLEALKKINVVCQPTLSFSWEKYGISRDLGLRRRF